MKNRPGMKTSPVRTYWTIPVQDAVNKKKLMAITNRQNFKHSSQNAVILDEQL